MPKASNVVKMPASRAQRFSAQIDRVLDELEGDLPIPFKEKVAALYTLVRIQALVNKGGADVGAGSSVRKYASAFQAKNAGRGGKGTARSVARTLDLEADDDEDGPDAA